MSKFSLIKILWTHLDDEIQKVAFLNIPHGEFDYLDKNNLEIKQLFQSNR